MTLKADVDALVSKFTADLQNLVRSAAVEAVRDALWAPTALATRRAANNASGRKAPRPAVSDAAFEATRPPSPKPAVKTAAKTTKGTPRLRRSAADIAQAGEQVAAYVKANPGSNAEKIKAALKIPSNQWSLAIGAALDSKKVSRKGIKRAAVYSPAGSALLAKPAPVPPIKRSK